MTNYRIRFMLVAAVVILAASDVAAQALTYATIYSFQGPPDGDGPRGGLLLGKNGSLYGTTCYGGPNECASAFGDYACGTVFELRHAQGNTWKETILHNFSGSDGALPNASLVFDSAGVLYSTTESGGAGAGTIFSLTPPSVAGGTWTESVIYNFTGSLNNVNRTPWGAVLIGPGGTLYTTAEGDCCGSGTAVGVSPPTKQGSPWTGSVIYTFGYTAGGNPPAGFVSEAGSLYGTTFEGSDQGCGVGGCGAVYELTPPVAAGGAWTETTIHSFGNAPDAGGPQAGLVIGTGGVLYGTTFFGGSGGAPCEFENGPGCGAVFQLTPPAEAGGPWTETVIYGFTGTNGDGAFPAGGVVLGPNGVLYGTTQYGGSVIAGSPCNNYGVSGCGTVSQLTPPIVPGGAWTETVLHSFSGLDGDGAIPWAGLTLSSDGVLFGTTSAGGTAGYGTVLAIKP
jgi:hypothetical protein